MSGIDIVAQLRQGAYTDALDNELMQSAADTIEFLRTEVDRLKDSIEEGARWRRAGENELRTEIDRLGESLNKCHEQMQRRTDGPVHGVELERSLLAGGRYRAPECGGFQGFED